MIKRRKTRYHKRAMQIFLLVLLMNGILMGRLFQIMIIDGEFYTEKARELHERERMIKAARGRIFDRNGVIVGDNRVVCTISVIHNQITEPERVIEVLSKELEMSEETVRKRVEKYSSIERIRSNVEIEIGKRIREYNLDGVKVDEDYKRYYPYGEIASKVLGFTGGDNQGIIGLEVVYDKYLQGKAGTILTVTDAKGVELEREAEHRIEPIKGADLRLTLDWNIQTYATQLCELTMKKTNAKRVSMIVMNPQNGEIYAMTDVPEFDLNAPYDTGGLVFAQEGEHQNYLNQVWRNGCINDTYEPGSTFKIITAAAALESNTVTTQDSFHCPGYIMVEDRRIRCHKVTGHGSETFTQGIMNSCNPVFISVGMRLGVENFYRFFEQFGLFQKTGIDLPGEAGTIMHQMENMGPVELATCSFWQSFQISPIQLITTVSSLINGGRRITPHLAKETLYEDGSVKEVFSYEETTGHVSQDTSEELRMLLEKVVSEGGGKSAYIEGFRIGGKTATSQTLPRSSGKYIASFLGFAPANDPQVIALVVIHEPVGTYYGGQIAAPVIQNLYQNILPYLEGMDYNR